MSSAVPATIGRYQVVRVLGEGGMGSVYLARDPAIDRHVAIKLMRTGFDGANLRERFAREAKSIGRLHHPNIVTIFDVGEHNGDPFIAMEYVEGETLSALTRRVATIGLLDRLNWMDGMCAGLHYAHKAGIIHRDVKPANIMVDVDSAVKILDFGIARAATSGTTQTATQAGQVLGTLNYMSPEQLSGKPVDHRTDIFSAGAVFYELCCGKMAFPGDITTGVLHLILSAGPASLTQLVPGLPTDVAAIVDKCLARDVDQRYPDFAAVRRDLSVVRRRLETAGKPDPTLVVPPKPEPAAERPVRTPGVQTRAELVRMRQEKIAQHLKDAQGAFDRRDFTAAIEACRQALIIDPEHADVLGFEERIQSAAQADKFLAQARTELEHGALTAAASLLDRVAALKVDQQDAESLRTQVADARKRLEDIERRARALTEALTRGRQAFAAGQLDRAGAAVDEALKLAPGQHDAMQLRAQLDDALRRAQEETRASQAVARARERFAAGDHEAALTLLRAYQPAHQAVRAALSDLEAEMAVLTKRADEARRQQEEVRRVQEEARRQQIEQAAREADARRKADEVRRRDEERLKHEAEAGRLEAQRQETERKAQAAKAAQEAEARAKEETRARAEAARVADAKRKSEAQRLANEARLQREQQRLEARHQAGVEHAARIAAKTAAREAKHRDRMARRSQPVAGAAWWRSPAVAAAAIVALLLGGVGLWRMSRPAPVAAPVAVFFDVRPWANLESIVRKADGHAVATHDAATPVVVPLEPGEYHVTARNPYFPLALEFDVTVAAGGSQDVRRALPGFNADDEARRILAGGK